MIYHIQTYCTYGYWPEDLSSQSNKSIIVACDICGKVRHTLKRRDNKLCTSCTSIKRWSDSKEQEKQSKIQKERYQDPKERKKSSDAAIKMYKDDPSIKERISLGVKNSESYRTSQKNQVGGDDICKHHYIYDFNDLNKYTIEVTRSEHATIHNNLRFAKLEVPYINILKED